MPRVSSSISSFENFESQPRGFATIGWPLVLLLLIVGTALYLIVFTSGVSKPLTNALDGEYLDFKTQHLIATADRPRIIILAGSNGRWLDANGLDRGTGEAAFYPRCLTWWRKCLPVADRRKPSKFRSAC
jgi:hypothetical protein